MKKYVYFYFMKNNKIEEIKLTAKSHTDYWHEKKLDSYQGGPFSDRSGGLIIFNSDSTNIEELVNEYPFLKNGLLELFWVKEWVIIK